MMWRDVAGEHPLEALYRARDLTWQAVRGAAQSRITEAEQASYEHAVYALLDASEHLSTACELPRRSPIEVISSTSCGLFVLGEYEGGLGDVADFAGAGGDAA